MSGRTGCNQTVSSAPLLRPHSLVLATLPCLLWPGPAILHTEKSHDYLQLWKHSTFPSRKVKRFPKISKIPQILPKIVKNANFLNRIFSCEDAAQQVLMSVCVSVCQQFTFQTIAASLYKSVQVCSSLYKFVQVCTSSYKSVQVCTKILRGSKALSELA